MGIILGLVAALAWGVGDFFAARLSRLAGTRRAPIFTQSLGVLASFLIICVLRKSVPAANPLSWLCVVGLGVTHALATVLFYRALEVGKVSLTTPIISAFAVVTTILAIITGEPPAKLAICGVALAITGLVLMSIGHKGDEGEARLEAELGEAEAPEKQRTGMLEAVGAALTFGFTFWGMNRMQGQFGGEWLIFMFRFVTVPILGVLFFATRGKNPIPAPIPNKSFLWICAVTVISCDTIAWMSVARGGSMENVAVVTTLASLYSAITILLTWLLWHERLEKLQWLGVAVILAGVALVGMK